jgi:phage virion morphogenesis protein
MSAEMTLTIRDLPAFEHVVGRILTRSRDLAPLMERIGMYGESSTIERFNTETAPDGSRWKASIRARVEGGKTLTDSARLKQSITHRAGRDTAEWGSNVIYAGVHQGGATIHAKAGGRLAFRLPGNLRFVRPEQVVLPARPFLGLSGEDEEEIVALGEDYFAELLP